MAGLALIISSFCNVTFCEAVYDNPLTNTQLSKQRAEILVLQEELNGKHLKVGTYDNYPLSWVQRENGTLVGRGVAFTILDILQETFNFTFEVHTPLKNFEYGGDKLEDSLLGLVNSTKVDMAVAFLPILYKYQSLVDFSTILDGGLWMMMLKRPKESAAGSGLLAPFETHVWYLILIAVLAYGPCITLLTYIRSKMVDNEEEHIPMSPSFWFVYGAFIKQGTTLAPEANTTRVLFTTWWLFIILLSSFYTANLTAFLTLSKFTLDIEYPRDLYKKNYRWVASEGSSVEFVVKDPDQDLHYLSKMIANGRATFRSMNVDSQFLPLVSGGTVLVKEQTAIDHLMFADYMRKTREGVLEAERCTYVVAPHHFMELLRGFAFPKGSKLKKVFDPVSGSLGPQLNRNKRSCHGYKPELKRITLAAVLVYGLMYLLQSGIIKFLEHRDLPSTKICPLDLQSKDRKLRNSDLTMTYVIMAIGLAAAIAVFAGEMLIRYVVRVKLRKSRGDRSKVKPKKSHHNFASYVDDSRPPPYDSLFGNNSRYKMPENAKKKVINGREYWIVGTVNGDTRLIPIRTPSAFLYQRGK